MLIMKANSDIIKPGYTHVFYSILVNHYMYIYKPSN